MQGNFFNSYYKDLEQYVVKQNDSLYMIAKKYNISVEELKNINHLYTNMIYPNQILFIPRQENQNCNGYIDGFKNKYPFENKVYNNNYYIVTNGDSIEDLLAKFNLSPLEFLKLNEKNILIVGQKIIIKK